MRTGYDSVMALYERVMSRRKRLSSVVPSFTCPRCGMMSYHPDDVREGYCGSCHDWTQPR